MNLSLIRKKIGKTAHRAYKALDNIFTEKEAWMLFRLATFVETIGWACLLFGISSVALKLPFNGGYLAISGSIHGIFYLFYLFIVIFAHRSLKWSVWRFLFAEGISVVPFGALVFEWWVAARRKHGKY